MAYFRSQLRLRQEVGQALGLQVSTNEAVSDEVVALATERFLATKALIGSPTTCADLVREIQDAGADEIACLVDFGVPRERVTPSLVHLDRLRQMTFRRPRLAAIRERLARTLPAFMVPANVILLDSLPLTPSGKVDRNALPVPNILNHQRNGYVGVRNATEEKLAAIWANVLRVEKVGITDRFFDLGGNSIAAIRVINQARKDLGLKISLRMLFERQTISALEVTAGVSDEPSDKSPLLRLKPGAKGIPIFCFHGGAGTASFYSRLGKYLDKDASLYAFEYPPLLSGGRGYEDVPALTREFIPLIRQIQPLGPYQLLGWSFGGLTAFETARQLQSVGEDVTFLCLIDAYSGDPNFRGRIVTEEQAIEYLLKMYRVGADLDAIAAAGHAALLTVLKSSNLVPESFSTAELDRSLSVIKDLLRMKSLYQPPTYDGRVTYIEACLEKDESVDVISPWRSSIRGTLDVVRVNTSHFKVFDDENMDELGQAVRRALTHTRLRVNGDLSLSRSCSTGVDLGSTLAH